MLKKKYINLFGLLITISIIMILFFIPVHTLQFRNSSDGKLIFKQKIQPGYKFTLKYTHSVTLTPVWEIFIIDNKYNVMLIETDFMDQGAGMPYAAFGQEKFINGEGKFRITNMSRMIDTPFYYRIGAIRENIFYFKDKEINLSTLVGDKLLTIGVYKRNLYNYYWGGKL